MSARLYSDREESQLDEMGARLRLLRTKADRMTDQNKKDRCIDSYQRLKAGLDSLITQLEMMRISKASQKEALKGRLDAEMEEFGHTVDKAIKSYTCLAPVRREH